MKTKPNSEIYYFEVGYPVTNTEKARIGEEAFAEALSDYPIFMNVTYEKRQRDIDHLVLTAKHIVFNECKNTNAGFQMFYSWFLSHVVNRFANGLPIAQFYARSLGYPVENITYTLTVPRLNTDPTVKSALKGLKISVIQTGIQLLPKRDKKQWYNPVRKQFLSVINTLSNNRVDQVLSGLQFYVATSCASTADAELRFVGVE